MFSNVSWSAFSAITGVSLFVYYAVIGVLYFRPDISLGLSKLRDKNKKDPQGFNNDLTPPDVEELEAIVADLRYAVFERNGLSCSKEELLSAIYERLKNYAGLKVPAYRVALNNAIIVQAEDICNVRLRDQELNDLWNKA